MTAYQTPDAANVIAVFRDATPDQLQAGLDWYADARRIAGGFATTYGVTVEVAAGVIAALSPMNGWGANINLAARFLDAGGLDAGYLKAQLAKARRILAGDDVETVLSGLKTVNFYKSIVSEGREGVCIDRHAYCLAVDNREVSNAIPSLSPKRYAELVDCYVEAAIALSREFDMMLPVAVVQSVTWTVWRQRHWAVGAFDGNVVS